MMFRDSSEWVYWYEYHLNENAYVRMSFKYDSANKVFLQRDVYLYADDQEVESSDFLQKLSAYDKDRTWLKKQSKKVAEQYILGTWFKNGSSRYSLKNLGNMKIQYNELLEEKYEIFFEPNPTSFLNVGFLLLTRELGKMIWQKMMQVSGIHDIMECKKFFMKES